MGCNVTPSVPPRVVPAPPPASSLLARLQRDGHWVDGFTITVALAATPAQFIEAFYTTRLFKAERLVLRLLAGRASTDAQAAELARGTRERFAVWRVTARTADEILLTDDSGRTASWLMAVPAPSATGAATRLCFGSAIRPRVVSPSEPPRFSPLFHALLGLHTVYSRRLLLAAARRLQAAHGPAA